MNEFVEKYEIIHDKQYGFRKKTSNTNAIIAIVKEIQTLLDNKKKVLVVGLDLAQAFDSICHKTMFNKLETYGFRDSSFALLKNYLSERK